MKQRVYRLFCSLICMLLLSGCGTIMSLTEKDYTVYGGVRRDFQAIEEGGLLSVMAMLDLPLSFVFDTLLLPLTLSQ